MIKRSVNRSVLLSFLLLVNHLVWAGTTSNQSDSPLWLMSIADPALRDCVETTMTEQGWHAPDQVLALKCHSMDIQSLSGLEPFSALETLSLYNNHIADLGAELDKMQALTMLNLARNRLKAVHLSQFSSLQKLYLFDNGAELLVLSDMPKLALLKANNNRIARFDYERTPALEKIYIFNNALEHVDIYNLPALGYMDCRQNPMPDELYDEMDKQEEVVYLHDGNAEDWN